MCLSICLQCGRPGFNSWVGKIPWRQKWQSTPALLPGKSHGWRSLIGYSPWGHKESDTTEWLLQCVYKSHLSPKGFAEDGLSHLMSGEGSTVPFPWMRTLRISHWSSHKAGRRLQISHLPTHIHTCPPERIRTPPITSPHTPRGTRKQPAREETLNTHPSLTQCESGSKRSHRVHSWVQWWHPAPMAGWLLKGLQHLLPGRPQGTLAASPPTAV